jgi:hypothetical protein
MGKQYNKVEKRSRRAAYLKRKKAAVTAKSKPVPQAA